jgi:gliding motility-associated-like protein
LNFEGKICYLVDAIEGSNLYNMPKVSRSNAVCDVYEPLIYIPNAFVPEGVNRIFKPVVSIYDISSYELSIIDRLGQVIFYSKDSEEGWDGTIRLSGNRAEVGTYLYMLRIFDGNGIEIVRRGHVSLVD